MSLRAMALGLSLVVATVAQAGVNVRLVPRESGPFPPSDPGFTNSDVRVDIFLSQDTGSPKLVRLVQFDFNGTSTELQLRTPFTASLGGPPADDLKFWIFNSLALCAGDSNMCGAGHLIDGTLTDNRAPGLNTTYAAFGSETELGTNPTLQIELPGDGSEVRIGEIDVIFPEGIADGTYTLNVVNTAAVSGDAGAQVHWGYGANIAPNNVAITRLKATTPGDVTGGTVDLTVGTGVPATVVTWESVVTQGAAGEIGIELAADDRTSEPRNGGVSKIRVTFDEDIDAASADPINVSVSGCDAASLAVDLSGITIGVVVGATANTLEITFSPKLPDVARYEIILTGITAAGGPVLGDTDRIVHALAGDAQNARAVNVFDLSRIRGLIGTTFDPLILDHVRSDVTNDGRINVFDLSLARGRIPNRTSAISCP